MRGGRHPTVQTSSNGTRAELEQHLGFQFSDPKLLEQAFVHRSYLHENPDYPLASNERLEFLGDAILNYTVADELYRRFPEEPEGTLTKLRAGAVQRDTLARVAREMGLGQLLLLGRGEELTGGRERASNLSCVYEALAGAILIDAGQDRAKAFCLQTLQNALTSVIEGTMGADYKSQLQELVQARLLRGPMYKIVGEEGPPHARRFTVEVLVNDDVAGRGKGTSRQQAEKEAARNALLTLQPQ